MITPESVQAGDLVAIFSTDGRTFRGQLRVRELFPGRTLSISFDGPLPLGTTQGDILCLIRRRDEGTIIEARGVVPLDVGLHSRDGVLYAPVQYSQIQSLENQIIQLQGAVRQRETLILNLRTELAVLNQNYSRVQTLENNLAAAHRANNALREAIGSEQAHTIAVAIRLASQYRELHRLHHSCSSSTLRCQTCVEYDLLLGEIEIPSPEPVAARRTRRIKSSSDK